MENKINIAEILKDCPEGMELDCTMYDNATLLGVDNIDSSDYPIQILIGDERTVKLSKYGEYIETKFAKCVIFPKGKTTWEGFQRPFKDGDILAYSINSTKSTIFIYRYDNPRWNTSYFVALSGYSRGLFTDAAGALSSYNSNVRFATEEEKQKLFDAIKANGYKWNPETKTLEKLIEPKFKVGDRIKKKKEYISGIITDINDGDYRVEYKSGGVAFANIEFQDDWELVSDIKPKFKVGDKIKKKGLNNIYAIEIASIGQATYVFRGGNFQNIEYVDRDYELVPNKFDISTLVPFESRVLVRDHKSEIWFPAIWGLKTDDIYYPYIIVGGGHYDCCIPYESNEYLLGTTNDCPDFYKTWEE